MIAAGRLGALDVDLGDSNAPGFGLAFAGLHLGGNGIAVVVVRRAPSWPVLDTRTYIAAASVSNEAVMSFSISGVGGDSVSSFLG